MEMIKDFTGGDSLYEQGDTVNATNLFKLAVKLYDKDDYEPAMALFRKSGDPEGLRYMGNMYFNGYSVPKNESICYSMFKLASDLGLAWGHDEMAMKFVSEGQFTMAVPYLKKAVDLNNIDAQYLLGFLYLNGNGVKENRSEAKRLFKLAGDVGGHHEAFVKYRQMVCEYGECECSNCC